MRRFGFNVAVGMAALLLAVMSVFAAIGFGCFAVYLSLAAIVSPPLAALAAAFAALLFAIAVAGTATLFRQRARNNDLAAIADALSLGKTIGLESRTFLTAGLSKSTLVVLALGFAIGLSPKLRKLIGDLLLR